MVRMLACWAVAAICALGLGAASAPDGTRPLALTDVLALESASDPQISPDGAAVVHRRSAGGEAALWLMDADGANARRLGAGWSARWSPDGGRIAFVDTVEGQAEIFIQEIGAEAAPRRRLTHDERSHGDLAWSPDGRWIAFTAAAPDDRDAWPIPLPSAPEGRTWGAPPVVIDDLHFRTSAGGFRSDFRHIFLADARTGEVRQLTHGRWDVGARFLGVSFAGGVRWAPDGSALYFDGWMNQDAMANVETSAILAVDLDSGEVRQVTREPGFWRLPRVSPDGLRVAYTGSQPGRDAFAVQELRIVASDGRDEHVLATDLPDRIFSMEWADSGDALIVAVNHHGATNLHRFGLDGTVRRLSEGEHRFYLSSATQGVAVGTLTDPHRPSDVARVDLEAGGLEPLTHLNAALGAAALGEVESFWTQGADGARVQGWLVKPPDFSPERRYPLILDIHGGPDAMGGFEFDFRHHEFASRGYMVLYMNPRGATGYGAAFANGIDGGFPGELDTSDLEAGVDAILARGHVDPDRVYVMGCSAGGSLTAALTARSDRFAAAAVMCPVTNWISLAGTTDASAWAYSRFDRPFWEAPEAWLAHSPLMQAGRMNTPTLLVVGARDGRTPPSQTAELYVALKMRGVPARMLVFPNAGHGPWRSSPEDLMRLQLYLDDWFRSHVRNSRGEDAR